MVGQHRIVGQPAITMIEGLEFDDYVMTVSGIDVVAGCTEWNLEDAAIKQAVIEVAQRVIVAADSSKIGSKAFARVCRLDAVHDLVTDSGADEEFRGEVERAGATVHIV